jgi:hypothetical protein
VLDLPIEVPSLGQPDLSIEDVVPRDDGEGDPEAGGQARAPARSHSLHLELGSHWAGF